MDDTIYRQAAIEQVLAGKLSDDSLVECVEECNSMIEWAVDVLKNLPSAQPDVPDTNVGDCSDCIKHGGDWECDHIHCRKGRLPSAQPERKKGKWEYKMVNEGVIGFRCSACGDEVLLPTPFCRNCGEDMRQQKIQLSEGKRN